MPDLDTLLDSFDVDAILASFDANALISELQSGITTNLTFADATLDTNISVAGQSVNIDANVVLGIVDDSLFAGVYSTDGQSQNTDEQIANQYSLLTGYIHDAIANNNLVQDSRYSYVNGRLNGFSSSISNLQQISVNNNGAIAILEERISSNYTDLSQTFNAQIHTLSQTVANAQSATATLRTELLSTITNNQNALLAQIDDSFQTYTDNYTAQAQKITALESTINGKSAQIQQLFETTATLNGGVTALSARATLKLDVNGNVAGYDIYSNGQTSDFTITADTFRVYNGTAKVAPFYISNGSIFFNGGVSFSNITNTNLVANAINSNTTTINGDKITTGTVTADKIAVNTITADRISANNIASSASASFNSAVQAGWTTAVSLVYVNNKPKDVVVMVQYGGRTGWLQNGAEGYFQFLMQQDGVTKFDYGLSPCGQDSKAGGFTTVIPANTAVTFSIVTTKTDASTMTMSGMLSVIGVIS